MDHATLQQAMVAARNFCADETALDIEEIGTGNINDTFLVSPHSHRPFILQRLSRQAFNAPELICQNLEVLSRHLPAQRIASLVPTRRWDIPQLLPTRAHSLFWSDANNHFWRALSYIADTKPLACLSSPAEATEVGRALATFHTLVGPIDPAAFHITIPHFHETPHYFALYEKALAANPGCAASSLAKDCRNYIETHQEFMTILEEARRRGELQTTTIHGDPKLANILFDHQTGQSCALIDLDTVGPGLLLYDIGDCLRSCCNQGSTTYDLESSRFDSTFCVAILQGYLEEGPQLLAPGDKKYLLDAIQLIPLELGLRFFTDFLSGCRYFKTTGPEETLRRAGCQFRLAASVEAQRQLLSDEITSLLATP